MTETVKVQVIFEEMVGGVLFRDAIYYKDMAEYQAKVSDGSHEAQKALRLANYEDAKNNPAPVVVPTKEQLRAEKSELEARLAIIEVEIGKK